jgi:hypothetical protein
MLSFFSFSGYAAVVTSSLLFVVGTGRSREAVGTGNAIHHHSRRHQYHGRIVEIIDGIYIATGYCCFGNSNSIGAGTGRLEVIWILSGFRTILEKGKKKNKDFDDIMTRNNSIGQFN